MLKPLASLALLAALATAAAGAMIDTASIASYPVVVSTIALLFAGWTIAPILKGRLLARSGAEAPARVSSSDRSPGWTELLRAAAFCGVWILYASLLTTLGFVLSSALALVASLWITLGRPSLAAAVCAVVFVFALAVLVTTVLFVPVPKAAVDHWIDETVFTVTEE
jgi:hypothetical protein